MGQKSSYNSMDLWLSVNLSDFFYVCENRFRKEVYHNLFCSIILLIVMPIVDLLLAKISVYN